MKNLVSIVFALSIALAAATSSAQVTVAKRTGDAVGVDVSGVSAAGPTAQLVLGTLKNNLARSGWMQIAEPGRAEIFVKGSISESGGMVSFACSAANSAGQVYFSGTYSQSAAQAVYIAHQAAHDVVAKVTGKPTFFMARLAMIGIQGGSKELFISDSSAQSLQQLTQDRSIALKPRWSPDNRILSYTSYLKRYPDVYTIELATGIRKRVAAFPGVNSGGAVSPDGRSMALVLSKDGNPDLYVMDLATLRPIRLTNTPRAVEGSPSWSPDGSRIVYVSDASGTPQLYVVSRNGGAPERLTQRGSHNAAPDWGANGLVAYQSLVGKQFQIAVIDPATRQERIITPYDASYEDPSWSPDGRHLAAARSINYKSSVYLLDTMTSNLVPLTTSGEWTAPAWSR